MDNQETMRISVRYFVEFLLREGDIDRRHKESDKDAMQLGAKIHRKIQGRQDSTYEAEVFLKRIENLDKYNISIEGRADGIFLKEEQVWIDEIKGVARDLSYIKEPVPVHLAQAKCYAYFHSLSQALPEIGIQMTYCHMETEELKYFRQKYTIEELEAWFQALMKEFQKWTDFQYEWRLKRNQSIQGIQFPYEYREGQRDLVTGVYRTILRKKKLFIQAPTGVGKTIATIFPAVKAQGEGLGEKIFYLTAKTITRTAAEQTFSILKDQGLKSKVLTITAKEKFCLCEKMDCQPDYCPYAKGHYDRINDAVYELITTESTMDREILLRQAEKHQVCPFEMCLDASLYADAIICDYNYVFDPNVHLKRFFGEGIKGQYLFLVDEAHNLVERAREMYSAALYKEDFLEVNRFMKEKDRKISKCLERCNEHLLELKRECEHYEILDSVGSLAMNLLRLSGEMERYLEETKEDSEERDTLLQLYFQVKRFMDTYDVLDENYSIYTEHEEDGRFKIKLFCIHTAVRLKEFLDKAVSTVFFSATFLPILYYKELLGGTADDYAIYAKSPFHPSNRKVLIGTDVSSKYTRRGEKEYEKIGEYIRRTVLCKSGNYMVFFPSYQFMEAVYNQLSSIEGEGVTCFLQTSGMGEEEREQFLDEFRNNREGTLIGLCVMGGVFSEGIDLTEDSLIGALIVGTGLPMVCNEREILKQYYESRGMNGFDYAYRFSGMNKVLQSAGRVIRTDSDRGVILLLDERFCQFSYESLFPREWENKELCSLATMEEKIKAFWAK